MHSVYQVGSEEARARNAGVGRAGIASFRIVRGAISAPILCPVVRDEVRNQPDHPDARGDHPDGSGYV